MNESERFTNTNLEAVETEEEIRDLLQAAGSREPVPSEDLETIRSATRAEWQVVVSAERRAVKRRDLRMVALAASLILAVAVGWYLRASGPASAARVDFVLGQVSVEGDAFGPAGITAGSVLSVGAEIETMETGGEPTVLALQMAGGQLRLDGGTRVRLESADRLTLESGAIYFDSGPGGRKVGSAIEVVTAYGTIRDVGTQFDVRLSASGAPLRVRVREGAVALESGSGVRSANRGEALEVSADGSIALMQVAVDGESWAWVQVGSPTFEVEGATLAEFLGWASRETGWEIHYADRALEESAQTIRVHGDIEGKTAAQAVEDVLPTSGLGYVIGNGVLRVTDGD